MVPTNGTYKWHLQMVPTNGTYKLYLQMVPTNNHSNSRLYKSTIYYGIHSVLSVEFVVTIPVITVSNGRRPLSSAFLKYPFFSATEIFS
jgi:hypothetical protein